MEPIDVEILEEILAEETVVIERQQQLLDLGRKRIRELEHMLQSMCEALAERNATIDALNAQVADLNAQLAAVESDDTSDDAEVTRLTAGLEQLRSIIEALLHPQPGRHLVVDFGAPVKR